MNLDNKVDEHLIDKEAGRILRKVCEPEYVFLIQFISVLNS